MPQPIYECGINVVQFWPVWRIFSPVLYQLSYLSAGAAGKRNCRLLGIAATICDPSDRCKVPNAACGTTGGGRAIVYDFRTALDRD